MVFFLPFSIWSSCFFSFLLFFGKRDTSWHHTECIKFTKLTEVGNWQMVRWEDQVELAKLCGEDPPSNKEAKRYIKSMWDLLDTMDSLKKNDLKAIQEANGMICGSKPAIPFWQWRVAVKTKNINNAHENFSKKNEGWTFIWTNWKLSRV